MTRNARRRLVGLLVAGAVVLVLGLGGAVALCTRGNPIFGEVDAAGAPVVLRGALNADVAGRGVVADVDPFGRTATLSVGGVVLTRATLRPGQSVTVAGWGTLTVVRITPGPWRPHGGDGGASGAVETRFRAG